MPPPKNKTQPNVTPFTMFQPNLQSLLKNTLFKIRSGKAVHHSHIPTQRTVSHMWKKQPDGFFTCRITSPVAHKGHTMTTAPEQSHKTQQLGFSS